MLEKQPDPCLVIEQSIGKRWKVLISIESRNEFLKISNESKQCKACGVQFKNNANLLGHNPECPNTVFAPPEFKKFVER
jgi:hypothetical protein